MTRPDLGSTGHYAVAKSSREGGSMDDLLNRSSNGDSHEGFLNRYKVLMSPTAMSEPGGLENSRRHPMAAVPQIPPFSLTSSTRSGPLTQFFFFLLFLVKVIDMAGGQINDTYHGTHDSLVLVSWKAF